MFTVQLIMSKYCQLKLDIFSSLATPIQVGSMTQNIRLSVDVQYLVVRDEILRPRPRGNLPLDS